VTASVGSRHKFFGVSVLRKPPISGATARTQPCSSAGREGYPSRACALSFDQHLRAEGETRR